MIAAWQARDLGAAMAASSKVLAILPDDYVARALRARVAALQGDAARASTEAKAAWAVANTDAQKHEAARMMALTLFEQEAFLAAQVWLRRAIHHAPSDDVRRQTVSEFQSVRNANPWQVQLMFSAQETDNVNGGSSEDTVQVFFFEFELQPDAQALSGRELTYGTTVSRKLKKMGRWDVSVEGSFIATDVFLSDDAKEAAPNAQGSDYDQRQYILGTTLKTRASKHQHSIRFQGETVTFGGDALSDGLKVEYDHAYTLSSKMQLRSGLQLGRTLRDEDHERSSWRQEFRIGAARGFKAGFLSTDVTFYDVISDSGDVARDGWKVETGWHWRKPVYGVQIGLQASYEQTDFDNAFFGGSEDRADTTTRAKMSFVFQKLDLYGFAPRLDITFDETDSNVGLYSTEETGIQIGVQSTF